MRPRRATGAVWATALLCAAMTACGTARPGDPAAAAPAATSATGAAACGDGTSTGGTTGDGTTRGTAGERGGAGPATEDETGTPGPPTDADPGTPGPPTDADPGTPGPPTDADPGTPGPPTDGDGGATHCLPVGWFDMTRDFVDYYARHRTKADDGMWPPVATVRVHKAGGTEQAVVTVTFDPPAGGSDWEGRRVAEVFADWRHETYDDKGTLRVRTRDGDLVTEASW
ncbi:hypothetical protein N4G70_29835 [Streptomyces sp. ASQP_92]|uniref:hypothetical protein n=1 Tax=Streptomyces sp. ASQP_92 TaxID=2979116 RepID=UPI0021C131AE|nr:hypothetical protein [Streptomyces sp. ASQP_92]MCT9093036.1 hypothetical protein [Streptomyces sp. ASQP_92]